FLKDNCFFLFCERLSFRFNRHYLTPTFLLNPPSLVGFHSLRCFLTIISSSEYPKNFNVLTKRSFPSSVFRKSERVAPDFLERHITKYNISSFCQLIPTDSPFNISAYF